MGWASRNGFWDDTRDLCDIEEAGDSGSPSATKSAPTRSHEAGVFGTFCRSCGSCSGCSKLPAAPRSAHLVPLCGRLSRPFSRETRPRGERRFRGVWEAEFLAFWPRQARKARKRWGRKFSEPVAVSATTARVTGPRDG